MDAIDFIREELPDALLAKLDFNTVMSKQQALEKVEALEPTFGGIAIHYDQSGRRLEVVWSSELQKKWDGKLKEGQKVRYIQKDSKGNVIEDMCRDGVIVKDGLFWVSCDRCIYADFGEGASMYDIIHLEPKE